MGEMGGRMGGEGAQWGVGAEWGEMGGKGGDGGQNGGWGERVGGGGRGTGITIHPCSPSPHPSTLFSSDLSLICRKFIMI